MPHHHFRSTTVVIPWEVLLHYRNGSALAFSDPRCRMTNVSADCERTLLSPWSTSGIETLDGEATGQHCCTVMYMIETNIHTDIQWERLTSRIIPLILQWAEVVCFLSQRIKFFNACEMGLKVDKGRAGASKNVSSFVSFVVSLRHCLLYNTAIYRYH
ncbi:Uncharacterized protein HZ326_26258 [Fusarium oxysporum f. sp. albedinis]|nr:Uncharacterized protein HZ326_26258 [Fusarium oxysporum f. sp. albedinis]